jgi:hypothetical protein
LMQSQVNFLVRSHHSGDGRLLSPPALRPCGRLCPRLLAPILWELEPRHPRQHTQGRGCRSDDDEAPGEHHLDELGRSRKSALLHDPRGRCKHQQRNGVRHPSPALHRLVGVWRWLRLQLCRAVTQSHRAPGGRSTTTQASILLEKSKAKRGVGEEITGTSFGGACNRRRWGSCRGAGGEGDRRGSTRADLPTEVQSARGKQLLDCTARSSQETHTHIVKHSHLNHVDLQQTGRT